MNRRTAAAALAALALVWGAARAAAPAGERLYVSDETGGNVVIVDPQAGQVVARIPVGKRPRGIQLSAGSRQRLTSRSPARPRPVRTSTNRSCRLPITAMTASAWWT